MFADVLVPPTFCFDWYTLDWPAGMITFLAVLACLVALFITMARRGRPGRNWLLLLTCLGLFIFADLVVYFIGIQRPRPRPRPDAFQRYIDETTQKNNVPSPDTR